MTTLAPEITVDESPIRAGLGDVVPVALSIAPFALAVGAAMAAAGIPLAAGWGGGALLLAGTAQLTVIDGLGGGGGLLAVVAAATIVNLRFALYSAGLDLWFAGSPRWRTMLLAATLIDQNFLLCERRFETHADPGWRWRYYVAVSAVMVAVFLSLQPVGYAMGNTLPDSLGLEVAVPLVFAGMLAMAVQRWSDLIAGAVAAAVVVFAAPLPGGLGLVVAIGAGVVAGSIGSNR